MIGFGMGGALVTAAAAADSQIADLHCGVVFHGVPDLTKYNANNIKIPIQAHFGLRDNLKGFSDPEVRVNDTKKSLFLLDSREIRKVVEGC
jgi:dienelactone hydrolase